jgi:hypothetical protein
VQRDVGVTIACGVRRRGLERDGLLLVPPHVQTDVADDREEPDHEVAAVVRLPVLIEPHERFLECVVRRLLVVEDADAVDVDLFLVAMEDLVECVEVPLLCQEEEIVVGAFFSLYGGASLHAWCAGSRQVLSFKRSISPRDPLLTGAVLLSAYSTRVRFRTYRTYTVITKMVTRSRSVATPAVSGCETDRACR